MSVDSDAARRGWHVPLLNVVVGMVAQAALLVLLTIAAVALVHATNPAQPPSSASSVDNDLAGGIVIAVLVVGGAPWLSLLIIRRLGGISGAGHGAQTGAVMVWAVLFAALLVMAGFAAFGIGLASVVCPVDAYECPL